MRGVSVGYSGYVLRGEYSATYVYEQDWKNTYYHSLEASKTVDIVFVGYDEGNIDIKSKGEIKIDGSFNNFSGKTTITADNGIGQMSANALIRSDGLSLYSSNGSIGSSISPIHFDTERGGT